MIFARRNHRAPSWAIRRQSTHVTQRGVNQLGCHFGMFDETIFVFHMSHPDDFCAPQPSRTIMGHPPTINPCHTTVHESIGVPLWHV
jgi:hypothetical protein